MTIYDIAQLAGVSGSTVSRVANGKSGVNQHTRDKILALLEQYNYTPNETARSLVTQSSKIIGIVIDNIHVTHYMEGSYYIERELADSGYYCLIVNANAGKGKLSAEDAMIEAVRNLEKHRVVGAVFVGATCGNADFRKAVNRYLSNIPVVLINSFVEHPNIYGVGADEKDGFSQCVRLLSRKGRKNLALLVDSGRISGPLIKAGFDAGIQEQNGTVNGWIYTNVENSTSGGGKVVQKILQDHPEVDGLICAQDFIAIGALNELYNRGIRVPKQIAIIGEDNSPYCEVCRPALTSLDNKLIAASISAARTLIDALEKRNPSHQTVLRMEVIERETT